MYLPNFDFFLQKLISYETKISRIENITFIAIKSIKLKILPNEFILIVYLYFFL